MEKKQLNDYVIVDNSEDLLSALKRKQNYIIVQENYRDEFEKNTELPLTETEEMGFQLGSRGTAGLVGSMFFHMINFFSKGSKVQKKIDSRIRKYHLKKWNENEILLYLRQLDY